MKHIFSRTVILLIVFLSLDRFIQYGLLSNISFYFGKEYGFLLSETKIIIKYIVYIPLISYLIIGLTFDRFKQFQNIRFYFLPVLIGILALFIKSPITAIIGYSILLLMGPFIQITVILKIFHYLKSQKFNDDRAFVLMFLSIGVFSFLAPFITQLNNISAFNVSDIFPLLNLVILFIFGLIYFLMPLKQIDVKQISNFKTQSYKVIILGLISLISLSFFSDILRNNLFVAGQDFKPESYRIIITLSVLFFFGTIFLFIPKLVSALKIKISIIIILLLGLISLFFSLNDISSSQNLVFNITAGLMSVLEVLFFPALIFIILNSTNYKYLAALLSLYYHTKFFVSDISGLLRKIDQDIIISIILILFLAGFIFVKYVHDIPIANNKTLNQQGDK